MRIGSLFSGAGGLDMAVEDVFGGETVWHCELDAAASKVLEYRWPGVPNLGDITTVDWTRVEPVDVLCGGWPCQPWSPAGKQKGVEDERALWPEVARAIRALRPRYVVLENVPGIVVLGELARAVGDLAAARYDAQWTCLSAGSVGAPHRRERMFILAHPNGGGFEVGAQRNSEPSQSQLQAPQWGDARGCGDDSVALLPTPAARDYKGGNTTVSDGSGGRRPVELADATRARGDGGASDLATVACLLPTPNASDGSGGGQHPDKRQGHSQQLIDYVLAPEQWGKYAPAIRRWEQVVGLAPWATELNRNGKPRLNPAFSEWMMGWPAGWVTQVPGISRNDQLRIIGNGVVPQCAMAALERLLTLEVA